MQQHELRMIQNIRQLALAAVSSGASRISIPVLKPQLPCGNEIHLANHSGPRGEWRTIESTAGGFVVTAEFKALTVVVWCDKFLTDGLAVAS